MNLSTVPVHRSSDLFGFGTVVNKNGTVCSMLYYKESTIAPLLPGPVGI